MRFNGSMSTWGLMGALGALIAACGGTVTTNHISPEDDGSDSVISTGGTSGHGGIVTRGGSAGGVSTGGSSGLPNEAFTPPIGVWEMQAAIEYTGQSHGLLGKCERINFVLSAPKWSNSGQIPATGGFNGWMTDFSMSCPVETDAGCWTGSVVLRAMGQCGARTSVTFDSVVLYGVDTNQDGVPDQVAGQAAGNLEAMGGDVAEFTEVFVRFTGLPDQTAPKILNTGVVLQPLEAVDLALSEPSRISAARLAGNPNIEFKTQLNEPTIRLQSQQILPLSASWTIEGMGRDFANNALPFGSVLKTANDPGIFAQDGFEGSPVMLLEGEARIVESVGSIKPSAGSHALFVEDGASATLHLVRKNNEQKLALSVALLSPYENTKEEQIEGVAVAGVIGGSERIPVAWKAPSDIETSDSTWPYVKTWTNVEVPLTEAGEDVLLRIAPPFCARQPCGYKRAVLVDEVHLK